MQLQRRSKSARRGRLDGAGLTGVAYAADVAANLLGCGFEVVDGFDAGSKDDVVGLRFDLSAVRVLDHYITVFDRRKSRLSQVAAAILVQLRVNVVEQLGVDAGTDGIEHLDQGHTVALLAEVLGGLHTGEAGADHDNILPGHLNLRLQCLMCRADILFVCTRNLRRYRRHTAMCLSIRK